MVKSGFRSEQQTK